MGWIKQSNRIHGRRFFNLCLFFLRSIALQILKKKNLQNRADGHGAKTISGEPLSFRKEDKDLDVKIIFDVDKKIVEFWRFDKNYWTFKIEEWEGEKFYPFVYLLSVNNCVKILD